MSFSACIPDCNINCIYIKFSISTPPTPDLLRRFSRVQTFSNFYAMYETHKFLNLIFRASVIPGVFIIIWLTGLISLAVVQLCMLVFFIVFVIFPIVFRYSITLQRGILFLTFITYPKNLDLTDPASIGLYGTRNFYINVPDADVDDGVRIGVWHVLPLYMAKRFSAQLGIYEELPDARNMTDDEEALTQLQNTVEQVTPDNEQFFYEHLLKVPGTVVLYLHGNTASRGAGHRVDMYKLLRKLGYHVLSLDYRGYGDSDQVSPTEEGVVRDAMAVYKYITTVTSNPVFVWGHSLGTGVAANLCAQLTGNVPRGVVLESPFTNIRDEIRQHPFARPFKDLPWFDLTIARPMYTNSLRFETDKHIAEFKQPVMILHAEDDYVVPFELGYKLYRIALDTRGMGWGPVEFHRFDGAMHYGHKYLCNATELPMLIDRFVNNYSKAKY